MYYIGIDVSTKERALCILEGKGKIARETKLPTDSEIIARLIDATGLVIERIGLESGCTAAWLFAGLQRPLARSSFRCKDGRSDPLASEHGDGHFVRPRRDLTGRPYLILSFNPPDPSIPASSGRDGRDDHNRHLE